MLMKRIDEAERDLLDASNKQPNDPDTLSNLIACQSHLGKPTTRYIKCLHRSFSQRFLRFAAS